MYMLVSKVLHHTYLVMRIAGIVSVMVLGYYLVGYLRHPTLHVMVDF